MKILPFNLAVLLTTALLWVFAMSFATAASAAETLSADISWDPPATYEGGSPLDLNDIEQYTIYDAGGAVVAEITNAGTTQYAHIMEANPGDEVCFQLTTTTERESAKSPVVCNTIPGVPGPPTSIELRFSFG